MKIDACRFDHAALPFLHLALPEHRPAKGHIGSESEKERNGRAAAELRNLRNRRRLHLDEQAEKPVMGSRNLFYGNNTIYVIFDQSAAMTEFSAEQRVDHGRSESEK